MNKNKTLGIVLGVFALVIVTTGASFAFFQYQRTGATKVNVTSGDIQFSYMEDNQDASLVNAFPVADSVGAVDTAGEYEFTVSMTSSSSTTVTKYNVILLDNNKGESNYFTNDQIKFALVKNNVYVADTSAAKGLKLSEVEGFTSTLTSGQGTVLFNQEITSGTTDTYKLRIWISDDVSYNNTITDGQETGKYNGYTYSLKVKVTSGIENDYGQITEVKPVVGSAAEKIMNLAAINTNELRIDQHEATEQTAATTEYRYYGATSNNYVTFNNELWRIIGVFDVDDGTGKVEKRVKIIRDQSIGNMAWDSNNVNEWSTSTLNTYLNGEYFTSLSSTAKSMIGNSVYYLGGITFNITKDATYAGERGTTVYSGRSTEITSKIALMYPSDYLYASPATCTQTSGSGSFNTTGCYDSDYLFNSQYQWTLSPYSSRAYSAFRVNSGGTADYDSVGNNREIHPVTYLTSNIEIESGTGTSFDPFILK